MQKRITAGLLLADRGMALALVLIFTGTLMVLGAAVITYAVNERIIAGYNSSDIRLYYIVEGGLETGIAVLKEDFDYESELSGNLGGGVFSIYFSDEYQHYNETRADEEGQEYYEGQEAVRFVRCVGTLGEHSKAMSAALTKNEDGEVGVLRWYRVMPVH